MATTAARRRGCSPPATTSSPRATTTSPPYFPPELIPLVARRLTSLQDFFALRASCRAYRAVLPLTQSNLASQAPLRLLVICNADKSAALFDFSLRRRLRFRLPLEDSLSGFTSLGGCRVIFCDSLGDSFYPEFRVVHLLTGEQTLLPSPKDDYSRFLLSGDLVFSWFFLGSTIKYCRLGDADCRVASVSELYHLRTLICVGGILYALVTEGAAFENPVCQLAVVELSDDNDLAELVLLGVPLDAPTGLYLYLGECCGELILVSLSPMKLNGARAYHVFRWESGEAKWLRITSLAGCALFFDEYNFNACLGPDHPGIRKDCMYFYEGGFWTEYSLVDGPFHRSGVVKLGRKLERGFLPAGWLFPSMC